MTTAADTNEASAVALRRVGGRGEPQRAAPAAPTRPAGSASAFWPVALLALAFTAWTAFQTVQLVLEMNALRVSYAQQEALVQNSTKLRQSLDSMAAQTQRLADQGNANARMLVDELRKRGVTINPTGAGAASAPAK